MSRLFDPARCHVFFSLKTVALRNDFMVKEKISLITEMNVNVNFLAEKTLRKAEAILVIMCR